MRFVRCAATDRHPRLDRAGETFEGIRRQTSRRGARADDGASGSRRQRHASTVCELFVHPEWPRPGSRHAHVSPTIPSSSSTPDATRSSPGPPARPRRLTVPTTANLRHGATVVHGHRRRDRRRPWRSSCTSRRSAAASRRSSSRRARPGSRSPGGESQDVADFARAAERLVVDGAEMGDLLWVEGQGSLIHPYYRGDARPLPRRVAPRPRPLPQGGRHSHRGAARAPDPAALRSSWSSPSASRCPCVQLPSPVWP